MGARALPTLGSRAGRPHRSSNRSDDRRRARWLGLRLAARRSRRGDRARGGGASARGAQGRRFLASLDLDRGARFYPDGVAVTGRPQAGDGEGWIAAAERAVAKRSGMGLSCPVVACDHNSGRSTGLAGPPGLWRERHRRPARQRDRAGCAGGRDPLPLRLTARADQGGGRPRAGLLGRVGGHRLPQPGSAWSSQGNAPQAGRESTPYGIPPIEGWTPGEVWTAPTAWSACALIELGEIRSADRLLGRAASRRDPTRHSPRARRRRERGPHLDHAPRLVARLRDPGAAGPLSRLAPSPGHAADDRAASTASSGVSASTIPRSVPASLRSFQLRIATTGRPSLRAKAISESVPHSPPTAITACPEATTARFRAWPVPGRDGVGDVRVGVRGREGGEDRRARCRPPPRRPSRRPPSRR